MAQNKDKQIEKRFKEILEFYKKNDEDIEVDGKVIVKDTEYGTFVPSDMKKVFELFKSIGLDKYKRFIDLGSGDGRIVFIASLFTKADGIEGNKALYDKSIDIKKKLKIEAGIMRKDFMAHNLSQYDVVYMYPDKRFSDELNNKLKKELKGKLILFSKAFLPEGFKIDYVDISWMKFCICKNA